MCASGERGSIAARIHLADDSHSGRALPPKLCHRSTETVCIRTYISSVHIWKECKSMNTYRYHTCKAWSMMIAQWSVERKFFSLLSFYRQLLVFAVLVESRSGDISRFAPIYIRVCERAVSTMTSENASGSAQNRPYWLPSKWSMYPIRSQRVWLRAV